MCNDAAGCRINVGVIEIIVTAISNIVAIMEIIVGITAISVVGIDIAVRVYDSMVAVIWIIAFT